MVVMESFQKKRKIAAREDEDKDDTNNGNCSIPENDGVDRLSSLPDNLLITIICFLPINAAAATSVLSRRWRNLWTHTTHLYFTLNWDDFQSLVTTVNHIIPQLKSPKIHTFRLRFPYELSCNTIHESELSYDFLIPWLREIWLRDPEVIHVRINAPTSKFLQIPHFLFESQSLVELQLWGTIDFNFLLDGKSSSIKFPNLKKLALFLTDPHFALLGKNRTLFKACPLLEDLCLNLGFTGNDQILHISNPNLKRLRLMIVETRSSEDSKIVIDSPKLEKCDLIGDLMPFEFVDNTRSLQEVMLFIREPSFAGDTRKILWLIKGISCVRTLKLKYGSSTMLLHSICQFEALPKFKNLTHFSFSYDCYILDELPSCLLSGKRLKRVDIHGLKCHDCEISLVQHLLSNAGSLEQLLVCAVDCCGDEDHLRKEYEFCKKLFRLSKSSVKCQIEFSAVAIVASSNKFGDDGVLTCQIRNH